MSHTTLNLPQRMLQVACNGPGGPEVMSLVEAPLPSIGAGDVLIRVSWAGVNRPDVLQRAGAYPPPPDASPVLGLEVSGEVVATGEGVDLPIGTRVCALVPGGGYAQYCRAPAAHCLPIPAGLDLRAAAALPETLFTVWTNVFDRARLQAGEHFLVHGGSSGIGVAAIQLAKAAGATVFATVGSEEKRQACLALGADAVINYRDQDFVAEIKALTAKQGVNVILDMVGGAYVQKNLACLAVEGRLVNIAFLQGSRVDVDLMPVMLKRLTVTGSTLRPRSHDEKAAIAVTLRSRVWPWIESGRVRAVVDRSFPLAEVQAAHRVMESSAHIGKIMLEVAGG